MNSKRPHTAPRLIQSLRVLAFAISAALILAMLTACFGSSAPQRTYYSIQYPLDRAWSYESPHFSEMVRIKRFDSAMAYDKQEMVYRSNPHEFQYYWYRLWAAKPRKMLREVFTSHLRSSNIFSQVVLDIGDRLPDYDLEAEILAVEELNASKEEWYAHFSMRLSLSRFEDGKEMWSYTIDERRRVYNRQPVYVVRTLSEIAQDGFNEALADLDATLSESVEAPTPKGGPGVIKADQDKPEEGAADAASESQDDNRPRATLKNKKP